MRIKIQLKTYLFLVILLTAFCSFSQNKGAVWATIEDISILKKTNNNKNENSRFQNSLIQKISTLYKITSIVPAFPNSENSELKKVYEFQCDCNQAYLSQFLEKFGNGISKPQEAPNFELLEEPNDYNLSFVKDYALDLINAKDAWGISKGDSNIVIGISDANFKASNQELAGKIQYIDPLLNNPDVTHGTEVAITAAGKTNNNYGKSSIGYNSGLKLYGMGYNQILQASQDGVKVINMSWASGCSFNSYCQQVIDEIYKNGTILVASAGNGNTCGTPDRLVYPSAYNHVISVTSIGINDNHEYKNGSGVTMTHQHNSTVDISAPGYAIPVIGPNGGANYVYGTSFAAPLVTGTIALMLEVNPCLTAEQIEKILKESSTNIDDKNPTYIGIIGAGRLNAGEALRRVKMLKNLNLNISETNYSCQTETRKVTLAANGGTAPYSYSINNTACNSVLDSIKDGTYVITLKDSIGCKTDTTITIGNINKISSNFDYIGTVLINSPTFDFSDKNGDGIIKVKGNIVIGNGTNYEILSKRIEFGYNKGEFLGITVEKNASLSILKNSSLKGLSTCPTEWNGINIEPGNNEENAGQLKLDYVNIYNSKIAINTEPIDSINDTIKCGTFTISNSVFTNNKIGINLFSNKNTTDSSYIQKTIFLNDDSTNINPIHISVTNANTFALLKNRFFGNLKIPQENKGIAINSKNSNVYLAENLNKDLFSITPNGNEFYNLSIGIKTSHSDEKTHSIQILSSYFSNVNEAIILDKYSNGMINHNEIDVPIGKVATKSFGVSVNSNSSIVVTDNLFTTTNLSPYYQYGVIMKNSDTNKMDVYRNDFTGNFTVANLFEGNNLKTFVDCNTYSGKNENHWFVQDGKLGDQSGMDVNGQFLIYKNEFNKCIDDNPEIALDLNSTGFIYQSKEVYMPTKTAPEIVKHIILKNAEDNQCRNFYDPTPPIKTIDEELKEAGASIYPNPTSEISHVNWHETDIDEISIYNMTGKLEKTAIVSGTNGSFEINNLVNGVYLIKLSFKGLVFKTEKLVVER